MLRIHFFLPVHLLDAKNILIRFCFSWIPKKTKDKKTKNSTAKVTLKTVSFEAMIKKDMTHYGAISPY